MAKQTIAVELRDVNMLLDVVSEMMDKAEKCPGCGGANEHRPRCNLKRAIDKLDEAIAAPRRRRRIHEPV